MKKTKQFALICALAFLYSKVGAHLPAGTHGKPIQTSQLNSKAKFRDQCVVSATFTDMQVNNVRSRLQVSGDMWWDLSGGKYIVPKPEPGMTPVSSIFAGGIWIAGLDSGGNLKTACSTYRQYGNDWFPGPLGKSSGTTTPTVCANWDKHFTVFGKDIKQAKLAYQTASKDSRGRVTDPGFINVISKDIKGWPAKGNPYFSKIWGFDMPDHIDYLAYFWDNNSDQVYDPLDGDYPAIYIKGCESNPQFPDEIVFWIFNDEGSAADHTASRGKALRMEVQAQSFAFASTDELNNMTFLHYRMISRAAEALDSTFFGIWTDPDLGCYMDDYVGCDISNRPNGRKRNMMFVYNQDSEDGIAGVECGAGIGTYGTKIPILGIDLLKTPYDTKKIGHVEPEQAELGMTSFMYYGSNITNGSQTISSEPFQTIDFYRNLNAIWKDGTPLTIGGNGYNPGTVAKMTHFAFSGEPDKMKEWSMTMAQMPLGDYRTIQASGPVVLLPGAVNEYLIAIPWVPDQGGGTVSLQDLRHADDVAHDLFDRCFKVLAGPDAPDVDILELDNQLLFTLTNGNNSNNFNEEYGNSRKKGVGLEMPYGWIYNAGRPDSFYNFEGYRLYQLAGPEVAFGSSLVEQGSDKIRLVAQTDISNGVSRIYNWNAIPNPLDPSSPTYYPVLKVDAADKGLQHTFKVEKDYFAKGDDKRLVNHKKYYYAIVAYAYNNFQDFNKRTGVGQKFPYLEGINNVKTYVAIPRPIVDRKMNCEVGDGVVITRLDGVGIGGNFVEVSDETHEKILNDTFNGEVTYKKGKGPIAVKIYNPLEVKDGEFELSFFDTTPWDNILERTARWELKRKGSNESVISDRSIDRLNEQIIARYGFSISIAQTAEFAADPNRNVLNGAILTPENEQDIEYKNPSRSKWFSAITDGSQRGFDFVLNDGFSEIGLADPKQKLSTSIIKGQFLPYSLCAFRLRKSGMSWEAFATPGWTNVGNATNYAINKTIKGDFVNFANLAKVNNVDIVFTSDKSKWSRCIVVETCNLMYSDDGLLPKGKSDFKNANMSLRLDKSIGNDFDPDAPSDGSIGKSWFPGYAIDVETGKRLEIFFGENSGYDFSNNPSLQSVYRFSSPPTGGDMIWNPTADKVLQRLNGDDSKFSASNLIAGCGHYIYVTDQPYSNWIADYKLMTSNPNAKQQIIRNIRWTSMPVLNENSKMLSFKDGLVPNDVIIRLRVDNPYQVNIGTGLNNGYPLYGFSIKGQESSKLNTREAFSEVLDAIKVVPNPYYAYSEYENGPGSKTIKIVNLPAECVVTIYSLDGRFVRQFHRNEIPQKSSSDNPGFNLYQVNPDIEWNLKNNKGAEIAGGTYIIHVNAPGIGEKTIKWFGMLRPDMR